MSETGPIPPGGNVPPTPPPGSPQPAGAQPLNYTPAGGVPYQGPIPDNDARTMSMLAHLLGILGFIGPLIIWVIKKEQGGFVEDQSREALNFQLTVLIAWLVAFFLAFFLCVGVLLYPVIFIGNLIFCIMAAMKANAGFPYRYPINIRFITT